MPSIDDEEGLELAPGTAEVLQAATRVLAGVALRSLDVLDSAVTLPQFRLLAVLADLEPVPSPGSPTGWSSPGTWPAAPPRSTAAW
jgi:hypothetical protein